VVSRSHAGDPVVKRRRDPFARPWVPLSTEAKALGFQNCRVLQKHLRDEPFVRVLGDRWYVKHDQFRAWWERQMPG